MEPEIKTLPETKLIGKRLNMSFSNNKTFDLWSGFMPNRKQITVSKNNYLFSVEIYPSSFFVDFQIDNIFEKWAAVEVHDFNYVPEGMEQLVIPAGLYAVFIHKGPGNDTSTYEYIFSKWLPESTYAVDERPHFALMGEKYKNDSPDSEEELWIPIKSLAV